jgi:hypothetical protein
VFAIAWMGTRDIYIAVAITAVFIICMDYLFNEESVFCCLPSNFTDYHISLIENTDDVSPEEIKKAEEILEKANQKKLEKQYQEFASISSQK